METPINDIVKMIDIIKSHNGSKPSCFVGSPAEVAHLQECVGEPIIHYSATELFMNPRDYEIKELYSMAWEQFPYGNQQEITKIVMHLAAGEYTEACEIADKLARFIEF